jgi:hypothetical protein
MRAICSPTASGARRQAVDFWYLITCNQVSPRHPGGQCPEKAFFGGDERREINVMVPIS